MPQAKRTLTQRLASLERRVAKLARQLKEREALEALRPLPPAATRSTPERTSPVLYLPAEAAVLLGCSKVHVYRLISSGQLQAIDISIAGSIRTKYRIDDAEVARYTKEMQRRKP